MNPSICFFLKFLLLFNYSCMPFLPCPPIREKRTRVFSEKSEDTGQK